MIGHVGLPVEIAVRLGAEPMLFQVVQLAVALQQRDDRGLALPVGAQVKELFRSLDLSTIDVERIVKASRELAVPVLPMWQSAQETADVDRPAAVGPGST